MFEWTGGKLHMHWNDNTATLSLVTLQDGRLMDIASPAALHMNHVWSTFETPWGLLYGLPADDSLYIASIGEYVTTIT